jgi:WD40 repeat protein
MCCMQSGSSPRLLHCCPLMQSCCVSHLCAPHQHCCWVKPRATSPQKTACACPCACCVHCAGGFLLSASLDKSVRLWHLSQPGCLRQFWHTDFVTSVQFHPLDAQRFVSGGARAARRCMWLRQGACLAVLAWLQTGACWLTGLPALRWPLF